ncbi:MAG TPA: SulP family inorganic anion transporter [Candidatus Saccharimonadales bacterium]|nr:SulP family inorganic anion transporter [Candidatus Saccharimonadales bacterium]
MNLFPKAGIGIGGWQLSPPRIRFPFVSELRHYSGDKLRHDLIAGATLTLVSIPQAIGFALILGLPAMPVILAVVVGGFFSALFFSSYHHVFGPTTSVFLITAATLAANAGLMERLGLSPLQLAAYLAVMIGAIQFVAGMFNFGEVTKFISRSVVVGYTTAIGTLLMASQLGNGMGFSIQPGQPFLDTLRQVGEAVGSGNFSWWAIGIAALTLLIFEGIKRWRPSWPEPLIGLALLAVAARVFAYFQPELPFDLVKITAALPKVSTLPPLSNQMDILRETAGSAIAIAIIGMLEATAITKSLAARSGQHLDPNQELMGMGAGNLAVGLFGLPPASSSFTRSAVNLQSGAMSQMSSMFSSGAVLLIILFLTPVFNYIPVPALAAHLIRVGYRLINRSQIRVSTRSTHSDAVVFLATLGAALFLKLDVAIYVGIGVALALFLQKTSTPTLAEYTFNESGQLAELRDRNQRPNPQISIIHVEGELFFGAADLFQNQVRHQAEDENIRVFILRMKNARHLDATTVMALESLHDYLRKTGRHLLISGSSADVTRVLRNSGLLKQIGEENIFPAEINPTMATKRALARARELLPQKADLRVFYDRPQDGNSTGPKDDSDYAI